MKQVKNISLFLLFLCVAVLIGLVSCADNNAKAGGNTSSDLSGAGVSDEAETTEYCKADVPVNNYDGYNFRFLTNDHNSLTWAYTTMDVESTIAEPINDAVYKRNRAVEELYSVKITDYPKNFGEVENTAVKSIKSGESEYDVVIEDIRHTATLLTQKYLTDISGIPYINTKNKWWDSNIERDLTVCGYKYFLGGDYTLSHYDTTCILAFNKNLAAEYHSGDPYELVLNGNWTFDTFEKMLTTVTDDLDGNGVYNENDRYGLSSLSFVFYPSFMTGAEALAIAPDADGYPSYVLGSDHNTAVFERLLNMMHIENAVYDVVPKSKPHQLALDMFAADKALFWSQLVYWTTQLRDMKSDFGIIPYPKFDEKQQNYEAMMFGSPLSMIPTTNTELERTGILLEYMAAYSRNELIPAYYDITMKEKVSRDETTKQILDLIFGNRCYTLSQAYFVSVEDGLTRLFEQNKNTFTSYVASNEKIANKLIEKFVNSITK